MMREGLGLSHHELLQGSVRFPPVNADPGHRLAHRTARLKFHPRAPGVDAGTLGPDAHGSVHGARARTRRRARVKHLSDRVNKAVVVDTPLPPVVPELVIQVGFGGVLRRDRDASRTVRHEQRQHERDGEAAERAGRAARGHAHREL